MSEHVHPRDGQAFGLPCPDCVTRNEEMARLRQERDDAVKDKAEIERQRDAVRKCLDDSERDLKDARERCDIAEETIVAVAECGISRAREAESRAAAMEQAASDVIQHWQTVAAPVTGPGVSRMAYLLTQLEMALSPQQAGKGIPKHDPIPEQAAALAVAWRRYVELFETVPHGTEQQLAALLDLVPKEPPAGQEARATDEEIRDDFEIGSGGVPAGQEESDGD